MSIISVVSCPSFDVANGMVNFTTLEYGGVAIVTCDARYYATNGMSQMSVSCGHDKKWSTIPDCAGIFILVYCFIKNVIKVP